MATCTLLHQSIAELFDNFLSSGKIPNILISGSHGSGKRSLFDRFMQRIYNYDKKVIHQNVLEVNCAHGRGIRFIRDDLKFFARTTHSDKILFKTVLLLNADSLTIDAQSALRRLIELYSHSTRFFIIVQHKQRLMKPILSRFCNIHIPPFLHPTLHQYTNLHSFHLQPTQLLWTPILHQVQQQLSTFVAAAAAAAAPRPPIQHVFRFAKCFFYEYACNARMLLHILQTHFPFPQQSDAALWFHTSAREFKQEAMLMFTLLCHWSFEPDKRDESVSILRNGGGFVTNNPEFLRNSETVVER